MVNQRMKRLGIDGHSWTGGAGFLASVVVGHWSEIAGSCAAIATAMYMVLRAVREWVKLRGELRAKELVDESKFCANGACPNRKPAKRKPDED
jgi:hypothetical protein